MWMTPLEEMFLADCKLILKWNNEGDNSITIEGMKSAYENKYPDYLFDLVQHYNPTTHALSLQAVVQKRSNRCFPQPTPPVYIASINPCKPLPSAYELFGAENMTSPEAPKKPDYSQITKDIVNG